MRGTYDDEDQVDELEQGTDDPKLPKFHSSMKKHAGERSKSNSKFGKFPLKRQITQKSDFSNISDMP